jgi:hypothetical protein
MLGQMNELDSLKLLIPAKTIVAPIAIPTNLFYPRISLSSFMIC